MGPTCFFGRERQGAREQRGRYKTFKYFYIELIGLLILDLVLIG